ncbi:MAG TPA: hypothetical protein VH595_10990 [Verrucomicrobiae bacterium]|nr:hypothetical protein [Verrucomicrobiae bacterium]
MPNKHAPPEPVHIAGNNRGEQLALDKGKEPGRGQGRDYRSARDSTGINAKAEEPIDPSMPHIPPA